MTVDSPEFKIIVGICREDNPCDVDDAYGPGTYSRLFPKCIGCGDVFLKDEGKEEDDYCNECQRELDLQSRNEDPKHSQGRP